LAKSIKTKNGVLGMLAIFEGRIKRTPRLRKKQRTDGKF